MTEYIQRRRQSIASYIRDRPILNLCRRGVGLRGTSSHAWWWEQPMNLDLEREEDNSSVVSDDEDEAESQQSVEDSV